MAKSESSEGRVIASKGALAVLLSRLEGFKQPKVRVEQYETDSEVAAEVLWKAYMHGDIGKVSVDLGCGTGILGIGMLLVGARKVHFVDSDESAIKVAKNNLETVKSESSIQGEAVFKHLDIKDFNEKADFVIENPPFGVKVRHMDKVFLAKAFEISDLIYSFHKSEGQRFVEAFTKDNGFTVTDVLDFKFPLKATQSYHTRKIKRIEVKCFRIVRDSRRAKETKAF